jgi:hypothetical protein
MKRMGSEEMMALKEGMILSMSRFLTGLKRPLRLWLHASIIPVLCLMLHTPLWADSDKSDCTLSKGYMQRDVLMKDRVHVYDDNGRRVGTLGQDVLYKDRTNIYDSSGGKKGVLRKDALSHDRTIIYDRTGQRRGYLKQDQLQENKIGIYNEKGNQRGFLEKDSLFQDRSRIYLDGWD